MLLSAKLVTALNFTVLKVPVAKAALAVSLGALAWGMNGEAQRSSVGSVDLSAPHQTETAEELAQHIRLHDEVQYIGDKYLEDEKRLQQRPGEAVVQAF